MNELELLRQENAQLRAALEPLRPWTAHRYIYDARDLDLLSRKDAVERHVEADVLKITLQKMIELGIVADEFSLDGLV